MKEKIISDILKTRSTPMYAFDIGELKRRISFLRERLPKRAELCYAMKANTFIVKSLKEQIEWFEICSPGELRICQNVGIPKQKFVISGINKDEKDMRQLIKKREMIGCYTAESAGQFEMLHGLAKEYNQRIHVLLRLTSGNQFGIDQEELIALVKKYKYDPWVEICGLQYFSGTQKNSIKKLTREILKIDDYLEEINKECAFKMPKLEFGPGLPVTYFEGESFDEEEFLKEFSKLLLDMRYDGQITLEIGRSIAASCGTYFTKVVDTKCNNKENYAVVDGGIHQIVYFGQMMAMKHPKFSILPHRENGEEKEWNICGSLCTVNDFLVKRASLKDLKTGDVLAFEHTGAYCMTEGISLFLSRDLPEVVLVNEDGSYLTVRKPTKVDELNTAIENI